MNFDFYLPTRFVSGFGAVKANPEKLICGKHAFIVTGKNGAKKCGALDDVTDVLTANGVAYTHFDAVTENPPLLMCYDGGAQCRAAGADFVIAIGGGSVMDAAKAISAFATNQGIAPEQLFDVASLAQSLPIVCIPTTAGTGSEANPYAIMTLPDGTKKKTFSAPMSYPRVSLLDPAYTRSLSREYTISTALDAFAHALESFLSPKSNFFSESAALYAAKAIWEVLSQYPDDFDDAMRESLLYAATAAGIAINVTGTGFPHPLGYSITLLDGVPHGAACALFDGDFIEYNERTPEGKEKLDRFYDALGVKPKILKEYLPALSGVDLSMTEEEIRAHVDLVKDAKNYKNSPYVLSVEEMYEIYRKHFLKK
ncbi:MAG: iron-containing alcohol dehydrogenase [Clostridia bacterium]|nr:iron-containing alcohol dehydrogenase [Clostridia bacterium]